MQRSNIVTPGINIHTLPPLVLHNDAEYLLNFYEDSDAMDPNSPVRYELTEDK